MKKELKNTKNNARINRSIKSSIKNKNKKQVTSELNCFDRLISNDLHSSKLLDDIHFKNELNNNEEIAIAKNTKNNHKSKKRKVTFKLPEPTPVTFANIRGGKKNRKNKYENLRVLLDSGCSHSLILSKFCKIKNKNKKVRKYSTGSGTLTTTHEAEVQFTLSEFSTSKIITSKFSTIEDDVVGYDMVIGRDLMTTLNMDLLFSKKLVSWEGMEIPMRDFKSLSKHNYSRHELKAMVQTMQEPKATKESTSRMVEILDAKYEKANLKEVVAAATHLSDFQKEQLHQLLKKYEELFDGTLGEWQGPEVDFELKEGATPHSQRHYTVPHLYKETFRKELERLVKLGVLEKVQQSEWGSPTFIIPKKDGRVRFISDFRKLNTKIKRKPYPLPRIADTLQELEGFQYASALDLNMGYYHIILSPEASDMCTIVTEFGKFRYKRLPMGVSCSPDIFQAKINELLGDVVGVKAYIDDLLAVTKGSFDDHLEQLEEIFHRCQKAGLKVNADKSFFGVNEIEYLGYIVTPEGIKPNPKKIKAINAILRPTTTTEVRRFVGMVQYYRDLWPRRSHLLHPFTAVSSGKKNAKIKWSSELEKAFHEIKQLISKETLLTYPDWTKRFDIHTDASDYQLGAVISQDGKPIAFFSRKLNSAQKNYTTTEKELLSIVECCKEFRNILYGYPIKVYSDHKNLVHAATVSQSQRVMRWRLILEEYGPDIVHISGVDNTVADALSRLPTAATDQDDEPRIDAQDLPEEEKLVLEQDEAFPLDLSLIRRTQQHELNMKDSKLQKLIKDKKSGYHITTLDEVELVMHEDKIYVPKSLRLRTLEWYHHFLNHPGGERLYKTINRVAYWKGMTSQAENFCKKCKDCQFTKPQRRKYGHVPPKNVGKLVPWQTVHVDLIGPYSISTKQQQTDDTVIDKTFQLTCMTMIDPVTGWFEIVEVPNYIIKDLKKKISQQTIDKSSARISLLFDQTWLSRYPRPKKVIFDNGSEFKKDFVPLLKDWSIKPQPTTIKNPQANSPVERIHQVLRQMILAKKLQNQILDAIDPFGPLLASIAWAVRAAYNSATEATPAQLVFGRDMLFNINMLADWKALSLRKQNLVDKANLRENSKRVDYDYAVDQQVYIIKDGIHRKMDGPKLGPFLITEVFTNGTVRIQRDNVNERINIRRLEPHF